MAIGPANPAVVDFHMNDDSSRDWQLYALAVVVPIVIVVGFWLLDSWYG
jgi:heme/copper-type cytochrome/quinol oxidase subunit 4